MLGGLRVSLDVILQNGFLEMHSPTHVDILPEYIYDPIPIPESRLEALWLLTYMDERRHKLPLPARWKPVSAASTVDRKKGRSHCRFPHRFAHRSS